MKSKGESAYLQKCWGREKQNSHTLAKDCRKEEEVQHVGAQADLQERMSKNKGSYETFLKCDGE